MKINKKLLVFAALLLFAVFSLVTFFYRSSHVNKVELVVEDDTTKTSEEVEVDQNEVIEEPSITFVDGDRYTFVVDPNIFKIQLDGSPERQSWSYFESSDITLAKVTYDDYTSTLYFGLFKLKLGQKISPNRNIEYKLINKSEFSKYTRYDFSVRDMFNRDETSIYGYSSFWLMPDNSMVNMFLYGQGVADSAAKSYFDSVVNSFKLIE